MSGDLDALFRAYRRGDEESTTRLVRLLRPFAAAHALRACGDPDMAEDAAQEALLKALLHLDRLRDIARFPKWLATIARNEGHRCRQRRRETLLDAVTGEPGLDLSCLPRPPEPTDGAFWESNSARRVTDALSRLPSRLRRVLELRYFHGCSYEDIAEELAIPVTTAKGRLQMARDLFREWYEELESCEFCQEQLETFLAGRLGLESAWRVFDHLFQCESCLERMRVMAAVRAELLVHRVHHWHGAVDDLRLGLPWESPRLERRLLEAVDREPHRARHWLLLYLAFGSQNGDTAALEMAANIEPDSLAGLRARLSLAVRSGKTASAEHLLNAVAAAHGGRRGDAALLDRLDTACTAALLGRHEFTECFLREAVAHLSHDPMGPEARREPPAQVRSGTSGHEDLADHIGRIELLAADRCSEVTFLLWLTAGLTVGWGSATTERLRLRNWAQRPLDLPLVEHVCRHWLRAGDDDRAAAAVDHGLVLLQSSPWVTHNRWFENAITRLYRLGLREQAVRHARRYLHGLQTHQRAVALRGGSLAGYPQPPQEPGGFPENLEDRAVWRQIAAQSTCGRLGPGPSR